MVDVAALDAGRNVVTPPAALGPEEWVEVVRGW